MGGMGTSSSLGDTAVSPVVAATTPRPSGRRRHVNGRAPRAMVAVVSLTIVAIVGLALGPTPSHAARLGPPAPEARTADGTTATRGCKPPPDPTPAPSATPSGSPGPSASPDPSVAASPSPPPTPAPSRTPRPTPTPYLPPGIDVSVYNSTLDFGPIVAKGMRFAFIRASQGTDIVDSRFAVNARRARAAGLLTGAYHFFDYTTDGIAQADLFVDTALAQDMVTDAMPLAIDVECLARLGWAVWADTQPRLRAMVDRVYERTGRKPIIYTSRHMWGQVMGNDPTFGDLPLWVACWRCDKPLIPVGWKSWRFWQIRPYKFPEIGRTLDGNVFKGTDVTLENWRGAPVLIDDGNRLTDQRLVSVDVSLFDGTEVRTADDGASWGDWLPWARSVEHRLSPGDGERRVDVQVRRADGLEGPVLSDTILLDTTPPVLGLPRVRVLPAVVGSGGEVPVRITWTARDEVAGMDTSTLVHDCGPGLGGETLATAGRRTSAAEDIRRRVTIATDDVTPALDGTLTAGTCALTVRGQDNVGNRADPGEPTRVALAVTDQDDLRLRLGAGWFVGSQASAVGGTVLRSKTTGATVRATVQGNEVALVATRGPSRGRLAVRLDGVPVTVVDLYAAAIAPRSVVAVIRLPDAAPHTLRLTLLRASNPLSTGRRVDVDAIITHAATDPVPSPDPSPAP